MRIKKAIVTICILAITMVGLLASSALAVNAVYNRHYYRSSFNNTTIYGAYSSLVTYNDGTVFGSGVSGYTNNYKRATYNSYYYVAATHTFDTQSSKSSGYSNNTSVSTYVNGSGTFNNMTDKVLNFGEIYTGGGPQSGVSERIWVNRYRNNEMAHNDVNYPGFDI